MKHLDDKFNLSALEKKYLRSLEGQRRFQKLEKAFKALANPRYYIPSQEFLKKYAQEHSSMNKPPVSSGQQTLEQIRAAAQKVVIGKEKEIDSIALFILMRMARQKALAGNCTHTNLPKPSAIMIAGESGSGKSFVVNSVCRAMKCDFVEIPMATITGPGWHGGDLGDYYKRIAKRQQENPDLFTVIFFDEIDKHASNRASTDKTFNPTVELLALMDCHKGIFEYPAQGSKEDEVIVIDTNRCAFVFAGAFAKIEFQVIADRLGLDRCRQIVDEVNKMNYPTVEIAYKSAVHRLREHMTVDDLVSYGLSEEFIGRCGMFINMPPMTKDEINFAVSDKDKGLVHKYKRLIDKPFDIEISDVAIAQIVEEVLGGAGGARAIESLLMGPMLNLVNDANSDPAAAGAEIRWDPVENSLYYDLVA